MLLLIFDEQLRARAPDPLPAGAEVSWDGPILRRRADRTSDRLGSGSDARASSGSTTATTCPPTSGAPPGCGLRRRGAGNGGRGGCRRDRRPGEAPRRRVAARPDAITIVLAETRDEVVCAAWIRFERGTEFGTLWGGATLPGWRRKGIYRATVAYRANLARERGFRYLSVDASDDSRPILERLGFVPLTTTTPYVWSP